MPRKKKESKVHATDWMGNPQPEEALLWDAPLPRHTRDFTPKPKPKRRKPKLARKPRQAKSNLAHFDKVRLVEVRLTRQHSINAVNYGPGTIKVAKQLADVLLEQEMRAAQEEANFRAQDRAFVVRTGRNGMPRPVPVASESFDTDYATAVPFGRISGKDFPQQ